MEDDKKVQFRLDDDELKQIDNMKPFGVSRSGFMKEMAFFGMENTIIESDQRRRTEKKLIHELKEQTHINQAAISVTNHMIKDLDKKVDFIPTSITSRMTMDLVAYLKPALVDIVKYTMECCINDNDLRKRADLPVKTIDDGSGSDASQRTDIADINLLMSRVSSISDALTKLTEMGVFKQYLDKYDLMKI